MFCRHVKVSCLKRSASALVRALTSPMNMRKPWERLAGGETRGWARDARRGCADGLERLDFGRLLEVVESVLHVIDCHAAVDAIKAAVGDLGHPLVGSVPCFEVSARVSDDLIALFSAPSDLQHSSPVVLGRLAKGRNS